MKICLLMGSPLLEGNTATLLNPFVEKLIDLDVEVEYITLYDKDITGCIDCRACLKVVDEIWCSIYDDMEMILDSIKQSECIVFATPIFTWFCTAPMKAVLDRMFSFGKYVTNGGENHSILEGKKIAIFATYGDKLDRGMDLFEKAIERLAIDSNSTYIGSYSVRDVNGLDDFTEDRAVEGARNFAIKLADEFKLIDVAVETFK